MNVERKKKMESDNTYMHREILVIQVREIDRKFKLACDQIILLNNQIKDLQIRYERASKLNRRSFRYTLRTRLSTLEGLRNMYYEYATKRADELDQLHNQLAALDVGDESSDNFDSSDNLDYDSNENDDMSYPAELQSS